MSIMSTRALAAHPQLMDRLVTPPCLHHAASVPQLPVPGWLRQGPPTSCTPRMGWAVLGAWVDCGPHALAAGRQRAQHVAQGQPAQHLHVVKNTSRHCSTYNCFTNIVVMDRHGPARIFGNAVVYTHTGFSSILKNTGLGKDTQACMHGSPCMASGLWPARVLQWRPDLVQQQAFRQVQQACGTIAAVHICMDLYGSCSSWHSLMSPTGHAAASALYSQPLCRVALCLTGVCAGQVHTPVPKTRAATCT